MVDTLGNPPSVSDSDDAVAECTECGHTIRSDVNRCSACGERQVTKGEAAAIVAASLPLWAVTFAALDMLGSVDTAFVQGLLLGFAVFGPGATMVGVAKWREREEALRAGSNGVS